MFLNATRSPDCPAPRSCLSLFCVAAAAVRQINSEYQVRHAAYDVLRCTVWQPGGWGLPMMFSQPGFRGFLEDRDVASSKVCMICATPKRIFSSCSFAHQTLFNPPSISPFTSAVCSIYLCLSHFPWFSCRCRGPPPSLGVVQGARHKRGPKNTFFNNM